MHTTSAHRGLPRAGVDEVDLAGVRAILDLALAAPLRHETIVIVLDGRRRGLAIVTVTDTVEPHAVLDVVELMVSAPAHRDRVGAVVVASVRPGAPAADGDVDRWLEMTDLAEAAGVELLDWLVVDAQGVSFPRDLLGEPPRW